jgi:hypothetical protein
MTIIPGACARLSDKGITRYPKHAREGSDHGLPSSLRSTRRPPSSGSARG